MKYLLLTLLLASAATSSSAQQAPASSSPTLAATHADSVEVIHKAFRDSRRFARFGTLAEGLASGSQISILASGQLHDAPVRQTLCITGSVIYSGFLAAFLVRWVRFSKHQEVQAIRRFELHQPQSLYVQRRLATYALPKRKP